MRRLAIRTWFALSEDRPWLHLHLLLLTPNALCLHWTLVLSWILKVSLRLAEFMYPRHDDWSQTTDRSEAGGQRQTMRLQERLVVSSLG